jgi:hypothetical protein
MKLSAHLGVAHATQDDDWNPHNSNLAQRYRADSVGALARFARFLHIARAVFGASGFFSSRRFSSGLTGSSTVTARRPGVTFSQLSDLKSGKLKFEDAVSMAGAISGVKPNTALAAAASVVLIVSGRCQHGRRRIKLTTADHTRMPMVQP